MTKIYLLSLQLLVYAQVFSNGTGSQVILPPAYIGRRVHSNPTTPSYNQGSASSASRTYQIACDTRDVSHLKKPSYDPITVIHFLSQIFVATLLFTDIEMGKNRIACSSHFKVIVKRFANQNIFLYIFFLIAKPSISIEFSDFLLCKQTKH